MKTKTETKKTDAKDIADAIEANVNAITRWCISLDMFERYNTDCWTRAIETMNEMEVIAILAERDVDNEKALVGSGMQS